MDKHTEVKICVWDWNRLSQDEFIGLVKLPIPSLMKKHALNLSQAPDAMGSSTARWYSLQSDPPSTEDPGEIQLSFLYVPI